jgi:hypothetical protein
MSTVGHKTLSLLRVTDELTKRCEALATEKTAADQARKAAADAVGAAVEALVANGRIYAGQREKVAAALTGPSGHAEAVRLLRDLADHRNTAEAGLGGPNGGTKSASARTSGVRGDTPVTDWDDTDAGRKFREAILGR